MRRRQMNTDVEMTVGKTLSDCTIVSPATSTRVGLVLAVLTVAGFLSPCAFSSPVQWSQNGRWYEVVSVPTGITWTAANSAATAQNGYLASLTSAEENAFVFGLTQAATGVWFQSNEWRFGPWLGGYQPTKTDEPAGGWTWVTGETWSYTAWQQPPNNYLGSEDHLQFFGYPGDSATWNDLNGLTPLRGYVVEYIPEPATLALLGLGACALLARRRR